MNHARLTGRTVLVTGAAQGQGAAHAVRLADEGANVVLGDVSVEIAESVAETIRSRGGNATVVRLDVVSPESWEGAIAAAHDAFGALHGLVNNAGVSSTPSVTEWDLEAWQRVIAVNQTGVLLGMHSVVPALRAAGGGSIVNVASVWAHTAGDGGSIGYVASKSAVIGMTKSAALRLAEAGIRVNSISPGYLDHLMQGSEGNPTPDGIPMQRLARTDEFSGSVVFLLSEDASYVTGIDILVDGGVHLGAL